ncbi:MAG: site-specific integrase [Candidatus Omnitrophica bacterium]|nr:site-specific integrase [Candidatus Omnitrophota bacterium]
MEQWEKEFEIHANIIKYKGYEFQISPDRKYITIGLKKFLIPQPYQHHYNRSKKWRVDVQMGIDPEIHKRIRIKAYFDTYDTALKYAIYCILKREIEPRINLNKEEIKEKIEEELKYIRKEKSEKQILLEPQKSFRTKIKKRGKKFYVYLKEEGKTRAYSFNTYEEAERFLMEREKEKGKIFIKNEDLTLKEALNFYLENLYARKQDMKRVKHFSYFFSGFFKKWGENITFKEINETKIENYINERLKDINPRTGKNITETNIKNELKYLGVVWNFLIKNGYLKDSVNYANIVLKKRKFEIRKRERVLSYEEIIRFLKELMKVKDKQKQGICLIGLFTGARFLEIVKLKKENIRIMERNNEKYGIIYFPSEITKTQKPRTIDIPYEIAMFLLSISKNELLFPDYQTQYKQRKFSEWFHQEFLKDCEIENFVFHDFRHTWATIAAERGLTLRAIKELGGWKSSEIAERYINTREEKKNPMPEFINELILRLKELELKKEKKNEM